MWQYKWYSETVTGRQLWERYLRDMNMVQQPSSVGTPQLLYTVWKSHKEIHQVALTGHDICDQCESIRVQKEAGLTNTRSQALVAELEHREPSSIGSSNLRKPEPSSSSAA
eukprot:scaffold19048_cov146-Isochrysis_galbana.AAC.1